MSADEGPSQPPRRAQPSRREWWILARRIAAFLRGDINKAESLSEKPAVPVVPWIREAAADVFRKDNRVVLTYVPQQAPADSAAVKVREDIDEEVAA